MKSPATGVGIPVFRQIPTCPTSMVTARHVSSGEQHQVAVFVAPEEQQQIRPFVAQQFLELKYKGRPLRQKYQPDFLCYDKIIVEIKAVSALSDEHRAQVHNYLKATGMKLGLLVNFASVGKLEHERIVR